MALTLTLFYALKGKFSQILVTQNSSMEKESYGASSQNDTLFTLNVHNLTFEIPHISNQFK